eukprot:jgi/Hompol1/1125/HPOL_000045-RA
MASATIVVGWLGGSSNYVISNRVSSGHIEPTVLPANKIFATSAPLAVPAPSWAKLAFSFQWDVSAGVPLTAGPSDYIYAAGDTPVSGNAALPNATLTQHEITHGRIAGFDYSSVQTTSGTSVGGPILTLSDPTMYPVIVKLHGIFMFIAWGVSPFVGIYIARYMKDQLGVWWYRIHVAIMVVFCLLLSLGSALLIILFRSPPHFTDPHHILGLTVSISVVLQVVFGFLANAYWDPDRDRAGIWDLVHIWFGRLTFVAAIANLYLGLVLYQNIGYWLPLWAPIALGVYVFVACIIFALGERNFSREDSADDDLNGGKEAYYDSLPRNFEPGPSKRFDQTRPHTIDKRDAAPRISERPEPLQAPATASAGTFWDYIWGSKPEEAEEATKPTASNRGRQEERYSSYSMQRPQKARYPDSRDDGRYQNERSVRTTETRYGPSASSFSRVADQRSNPPPSASGSRSEARRQTDAGRSRDTGRNYGNDRQSTYYDDRDRDRRRDAGNRSRGRYEQESYFEDRGNDRSRGSERSRARENSNVDDRRRR